MTTPSSIAHETSEVGIGSSLPNGYSRSPASIGQTAATVQEASDGRLRVGLGPSGPRVIEATMEALAPRLAVTRAYQCRLFPDTADPGVRGYR